MKYPSTFGKESPSIQGSVDEIMRLSTDGNDNLRKEFHRLLNTAGLVAMQGSQLWCRCIATHWDQRQVMIDKSGV